MKKRFSMLVAGASQFMWALPVHAQGLKNSGGNLKNIGKAAGVNTEQDVGSMVGGIISAALSLVGVIFLALMVYAGFLWMTARGESDQITKAKNIVVSSLIGLGVVLSAYAITAFVTGSVGNLG